MQILSGSHTGRGYSVGRVAMGALAAAPAFVGYSVFILNHFYRYGAVLLDAGLLASLSWHEPVTQPVPILGIASFFAFHIAPILLALSALSWTVPLAMAQWFALFIGAAHALLAVAAFWILSSEYSMNAGWRATAAIVLSVVFSFNGLAIAQVRYPHFEIFLAASIIAFLVAWWRQRFVLAGFFLFLSLICREDAGFHVFAILAVLVALNRWRGMEFTAQKPAIVFLAIGFAYSASILLLQHFLFPHHSSFVRVYTGSPFFAHVNYELVKTRILVLVLARSYIVLPAVCATIWAIISRNPYILAGYVALIPWTVLNLLAKSELAGAMSSYYGFPYLIAAFWPLIGCRIDAQKTFHRPWEPMLGFAVMILASFTSLAVQHNPSGIDIWSGFTDPPTLGQQAKLENAMSAIQSDHAKLGRVHAGDGVISLRPKEFQANETVWDGTLAPSDTVLFFAGERNHDLVKALATNSGLRFQYSVRGTPIRVITNIPPSNWPALGPMLNPAGP